MRKLGFEETPDYDFLRELFTKVLKNSGEPEDGVYDWMMLNNGKGWEAGTVRGLFCTSSELTGVQSSSSLLAQASQPGYDSGRHHRASGQPRDRDRERERAERHAQRAAAAAAAAIAGPSGIISPSPALVRNGSKTGRNPSGSATPNANSSAMAVKGVSAATGQNKRSSGNQGGLQSSSTHPYASASQVQIGGFDHGASDTEYGAGAYRSSPAQLHPGGPTMMHAGGGQGDYLNEQDEPKGFSLLRFLTCRCG